MRQPLPIVATNVYLRTAAGWRMIVHHASPAPAQPQRRPPRDAPPKICTSNVLLAVVAARRPPADDRTPRCARRRACALAARALGDARRRLHRRRLRRRPAAARRLRAVPRPRGLLGQPLRARDRRATRCARGWRIAIAALPRLLGRAQPQAARLPLGRQRGDRLDRCGACGAPLYAVGVSLGGNALLKWLGERGDEARALVRRAAAVSAPLDLGAAGDALDRGLNRLLYTRHVPVDAEAEGARQAGGVSGPVSTRRRCARRAPSASSTTSSPRRCTAFATSTTTGARASSGPWLERIRVPTLVLNARNDPFLPEQRLLRAARKAAPCVVLEFPRTGGHVGFLAAPFPGRRLAPALDFLDVPPTRERSQPKSSAPTTSAASSAARLTRRSRARHRPRARLGRARAQRADLRGVPRRPALRARAGRRADRGPDAAGADVIDIGMAPTPVAYFAAHHLALRQLRRGERQPQPARVQRPQDGGRRRHALRRRDPGPAASESRTGSFSVGHGQAQRSATCSTPTSSASPAT